MSNAVAYNDFSEVGDRVHNAFSLAGENLEDFDTVAYPV